MSNIKLRFFLIALSVTNPLYAVYAAPNITGINGTISHGNSVVISGSGFEEKTNAAPAYFNNFDSETTGQPASGLNHAVCGSGLGAVVSTEQKRGSKSYLFDFTSTTSASENWRREVFDMGAGGASHIFFSSWIYLDYSVTDYQNAWQWKSVWIGSYPTGYTWNSPETAYGLDSWYNIHSMENSPYSITELYGANRWFNSLTSMWYNGTNGRSWPSSPERKGLAADAYPFNQWFRIDLYGQRSSAPLVADGQMYVDQLDTVHPVIQMENHFTNMTTHDVGNPEWRYVGFGQGLTNVIGGSGSVHLKVYYDDLYIDSSQARVEIGDAPVWSSCKHLEIQPATSWNSNGQSIIFNLNQGSFNGGEAYLYVVNSDGEVNTSGYPITFGSSSGDTTAPAAPGGLSVS